MFKLMCRGRIRQGVPVGTVAPEELDKSDVFASLEGTAAAVSLTTDLLGKITVIEHEHIPEIDQTAYGILSDLVRIVENRTAK